MKKLTELSKVLEDIKGTSKKIMQKTLKLMKLVERGEPELVEEFIFYLEDEGIPSPNKVSALQSLQKHVFDFLGSSEIVNKEIDHFVKANDEGFEIDADPEAVPFLSEVWNGDAYDKVEIEGLEQLLDELHEQLSGISKDDLFRKASSDFRV